LIFLSPSAIIHFILFYLFPFLSAWVFLSKKKGKRKKEKKRKKGKKKKRKSRKLSFPSVVLLCQSEARTQHGRDVTDHLPKVSARNIQKSDKRALLLLQRRGRDKNGQQ